MSLAKKTQRYLKRKKKVNERVKSLDFDYRFVVNRTNKYTYAHIIDRKGNTIVMMNDKGLEGKTKTERAAALGSQVAKKALENWVKKAIFDRNGFLYHGRVAALCDGARKEWLSL